MTHGRVFDRPRDALFTLLVLSDHPADFPNAYVVRAHAQFPDEPRPRFSSQVMLFQSEADARKWVAWEYPDFDEIGRNPADEPQIMTVWTERNLLEAKPN